MFHVEHFVVFFATSGLRASRCAMMSRPNLVPCDLTTDASPASTTRAQIRKAGLFYFVFVMYAYATAGPFGLEDQVTASGPGLTLGGWPSF